MIGISKKRKPRLIYKQIIKSHLILTVSTIAIIAISTWTIFYITLFHKVSESSNENLYFINNQMDNYFNQILGQLDKIAINPDLRRYLILEDQFSKNKDIYQPADISSLLDSYFYLEDAFTINLFTTTNIVKNPKILRYQNDYSLNEEAWFNGLIANEMDYFIYSSEPHYTKQSRNSLSIIYPVKNYAGDQTIGFIRVDIPHTSLENYIKRNVPAKLSLLITDYNNTVLFSTLDNMPLTDTIISQGSTFIDEVKINVNHESYLINKRRQSLSNLLIYTPVSLENEMSPIADLIVIMLPIIVILIALDIWMTYKTSYNLTAPINDLIRVMVDTESGNFTTYNQYHSDFIEINQLSHSYDAMMAEINRLVDTNYKNNLLRLESQLQAIQQKINPHFLFNTLETINGQAILENAPVVSKMTQTLGNLFRYNLRANDLVSLEDEIKYIQDYVYLIQLQGEKEIELYLNIHPATALFKLPKLTLQPLIENAIRHGFKNKRSGKITVKSLLINSGIEIIVEDNGQGIHPSAIKELETELLMDENNLQHFIDRHQHIGMRNVSARLCLSFDTSNCFTIESIPDKYTRITLTLPEKKEEMESS
ncbi:sensor histidine kinase [Vallitalea okinawensis]|uniref:sensor histidine kinase n=1 Tax=Vallitalea okinawensis TaxID=2078660 RepID=UPI000CFD021B|nr:sensor histidine kinase [Vallitalea okinawensis]